MIIQIEPGERFEAPANGDFQIECASSFSSAELDDPATIMGLDFQGPNLETGTIMGDNVGTNILFPLTSGQFASGEWVLSPYSIVAGQERRFPKPLIMIVVGKFQVHPEGC